MNENLKPTPNENYVLNMYPNDLLFWTHEGREYCLRALQESDPENPRDNENLGLMFCSHRRYNLGDNTGCATAGEFYADLIAEYVPKAELTARLRVETFPDYEADKTADDDDLYDDFIEVVKSDDNYKAGIKACEPYMEILPLWLYDHSGITISCGERSYPYNDQWDSGMVGWIVLSKTKTMGDLKVVQTDADGKPVMVKNQNGVMVPKYVPCDEHTWRQAAKECLKAEVREYDQYLTGEIYAYDLFSRPVNPNQHPEDQSCANDWTEEESYGGFFGADILENGAADAFGNGLRSAIESKNYQTGASKTETYVRLIFEKN